METSGNKKNKNINDAVQNLRAEASKVNTRKTAGRKNNISHEDPGCSSNHNKNSKLKKNQIATKPSLETTITKQELDNATKQQKERKVVEHNRLGKRRMTIHNFARENDNSDDLFERSDNNQQRSKLSKKNKQKPNDPSDKSEKPQIPVPKESKNPSTKKNGNSDVFVGPIDRSGLRRRCQTMNNSLYQNFNLDNSWKKRTVNQQKPNDNSDNLPKAEISMQKQQKNTTKKNEKSETVVGPIDRSGLKRRCMTRLPSF